MNYKKYLALAAKRNAEAAKLRAKGWTMQRIADHLGVSKQRISQLLGGKHGAA